MVIAWCRDTGIFEKSLDDRMPNKAKISEPFEKASKPLTMTQISPFMTVYGFGIALSIIAFMGEKVANIGASRPTHDFKLADDVPINKNPVDITEIVM